MLGKYKSLFFVACCVFSSSSYAQNMVLLLNDFKKAEQWDTKLQLGSTLLAMDNLSLNKKINVYSQLAEFAFSTGDLKNSLIYFKQLEQHTSLNKLPNLYFKAIKMQGVIFYYQGFYQKAVTEYSRALAVAIKNKYHLEQANMFNNIGLSYFKMNNMELTLVYYLKAEDIYRLKGNEQDKADIMLNIAGVYIRLSRYDSAFSVYQKLLNSYAKLADDNGLAQVYNNMGVAYYETNQFDLALHYYQLALNYYLSTNDEYNLSNQYTNLAKINLILNKIDVAYEQAEKAKEYALNIANQSLELMALHALAKVQFVKGELEQATVNLNRSIALAYKYKDELIVRDGLGVRSLIEASQGEYINAMNSHEEFIGKQRKLRSESIINALAVLQNQFKATQLTQEIKQLKQDSKVQELKMTQRTQLALFLSLLLFLVIVTSLALYRRGAEKRAKHKLAEQVEQRTLELQVVAQELREANDVKNKFLANISHEIRTPLTAILGQTDDLINGLYEPEQLQQELAVIQRHSEHLKSLINDVLDLSKIEANKLELNTSCFNVSQLLNDVYAMFIAQAKAKGLSLILDNQIGHEFYTQLDFIRVKQILINLCANAIKFTHHGEVSITVKEGDKGLFFIIQDTGIGMSESQLTLIFECFSQADNSITRRFGGTGLGLNLSQQLASMMKGHISVQSEFNEGSQFSLFLPCVRIAKELSTEEPKEDVVELKQLSGRILLAEDHRDNRRLIDRYLTSLGLEVIAVENGEQAVEQCLQEDPDLVLLDIQMPIMDGCSALALLQQCGFQKPIFALTANAMSHEVEHYLALGFNGYLAKPIDKQLFYKALAGHLDQKEHYKKPDIDMSDLVLRFKQSFSVEYKTLTEHFLNHDFVALKQDSHRLLGAAQMFELNDIAQAAKNLDDALLKMKEDNNTADIKEAMEALLSLFKVHNVN